MDGTHPRKMEILLSPARNDKGTDWNHASYSTHCFQCFCTKDGVRFWRRKRGGDETGLARLEMTCLFPMFHQLRLNPKKFQLTIRPYRCQMVLFGIQMVFFTHLRKKKKKRETESSMKRLMTHFCDLLLVWWGDGSYTSSLSFSEFIPAKLIQIMPRKRVSSSSFLRKATCEPYPTMAGTSWFCKGLK